MALTLTITNYPFRDRLNSVLVRKAQLTGPALYATGGIAIDNTGDFGWGSTHTLEGTITDGTTFYGLHLSFATQKIKVIAFTTGLEVANNTVLSAFGGQIFVTGQ